MWSSSDGVMGMLSRALTASSLRQRTIAHNLANFNTPGFKRYAVSFEDNLARAQGREALTLQQTHRHHLGNSAEEAVPVVQVDPSTSRRVDGNNVDLEKEMIDLVTNQLRYNACIQQVNSRFNRWRYVINEGRR